MNSILHKAHHAAIVMKPFPHIVIKNALDEELFEKLENEFPSIDTTWIQLVNAT